MPYSFKGAISFGLVYIPVALQAAVKNNDIGFHMLDKKTMSRVRYKKTCVDCGDREVKNEDIVKGYEYEKDQYVVFEEKDFEKLKTKRDRTIAIEQFAQLSEIDPVYFEKSYYVIPTGAERAYALLLAAMQEQDKVGIAKAVLGTKETLLAIRAQDGKMLLSTMYFPEEIQVSTAKPVDRDLNEKELSLARSLIENMTAPFAPENFRDEYRERILQAVEQKIAGKEITAPKEAPAAKVSDLLEALTRSLKATEPKRAAKPKMSKEKKKALG